MKNSFLFVFACLILCWMASCDDDNEQAGLVVSCDTLRMGIGYESFVEIKNGSGNYTITGSDTLVASLDIDKKTFWVKSYANGTSTVTVKDGNGEIRKVVVIVSDGDRNYAGEGYSTLIRSDDDVATSITKEMGDGFYFDNKYRVSLNYTGTHTGKIEFRNSEDELQAAGTFDELKREWTLDVNGEQKVIPYTYEMIIGGRSRANLQRNYSLTLCLDEDFTTYYQEKYPSGNVTHAIRGIRLKRNE